MNINLAVSQGLKILRKNYIPNAQLDSEILLAKTINKDRNYLFLNSNNILNKKELKKFYTLIQKRSIGNPVAYLTNKKFFLEFRVFCYK